MSWSRYWWRRRCHVVRQLKWCKIGKIEEGTGNFVRLFWLNRKATTRSQLTLKNIIWDTELFASYTTLYYTHTHTHARARTHTHTYINTYIHIHGTRTHGTRASHWHYTARTHTYIHTYTRHTRASPSLISRTVSVDVKHHVYLLHTRASHCQGTKLDRLHVTQCTYTLGTEPCTRRKHHSQIHTLNCRKRIYCNK